MKKTFCLLAVVAFACLSTSAQVVSIPDTLFLNLLIDLGVDQNHDRKIQSSEAASVTNLNVANFDLTDLTGIEAFTQLDTLNCSSNKLTSLDLSQNTKLTGLFCSINKLTFLDVTKCSELKHLFCSNNNLTQLDIFLLKKLVMLDCSFNDLSSLNVLGNAQLTMLECYSNLLTSLDLSANRLLTDLYCDNNQLTALDLYNNSLVKTLNCSYNQIATIELGKCLGLTVLSCFSNRLTELVLNANTNLKRMDVGLNPFTRLDLSKITDLTSLDCAQSPNLRYVCVPSVAAVTDNFNFYKDASTEWTEDCSLLTGLPQEPFSFEGLSLLPNPSKDAFVLHLSSPSEASVYNATGNIIEAFHQAQSIRFGQSYPSGVYLLHLQQAGKTKVFKAVKE